MVDSPAGVPVRASVRATRTWRRCVANCAASNLGQRELELAGRLHDEASQLLSLASMHLDMALCAGSAQPRQSVMNARVLVRDALAEVRAVISSLQGGHPCKPLAYVDLRAELQAMVTRLGKQSGRQISYREVRGPGQGQLKATSARASKALLEAARELITNACKHAPQGDIELTISWDADGMAISVQDLGPGLPRHTGPSFGLQLLHRRMATIGAHVSFVSDEDIGLQARIYLPWA